MLVLGLDTTTRVGSCALVRDGVVVHERASNPQISHAEHLPGDLMALLDAAGVGLDAIDVFGVAVGPGSFTGLRVGIATMQGLAFATKRPLIGVSALDALAHVAQRPCGPVASAASRTPAASVGRALPGSPGGPDKVLPNAAAPVRLATWIDAWRGEVYAALYENGREVEPASVEHPDSILSRLSERGGLRNVCFIGDGAQSFAQRIRDAGGHLAEPVSPLIAAAIAQIADACALAGDRPGPEDIRPLYVRRTDAELARDARHDR
ncbi:MAG TPA: tRNA (adenosine(37)-N6)-threonylcarbamoyltransferase complex dimerization subunit type 1 TsaB [Vicinamibacterales bacterium]|nr:tRNA (adenosine(37)-N6)-threonylcarbamoyltransferase complex dimerization subunit type 1 TsaB [Vicinamibacterales bacterium]